jgi:hypothetical protein
MFARWFPSLETVHRATTPEERQAIYRFRYTVYYEELGRLLGNPNHATRMVSDEDDERDVSVHLYTGSVKNLTGSLRLKCWQPGQIPKEYFDMYNMSIFPDIEQLRVAELGRLMIRPTLRGGMHLLSITRAAYQFLARDFKGDLAFCFGAPGLVRHYRKLGFTLYSCPLIPTPDGMNVGLVSVLSDDEQHRRVGSPVGTMAKRFYSREKRDRDRAIYAPIVCEASAPLEVDPQRVWADVESNLMQATEKPSMLDSLPTSVVRLMISKGFIIRVDADTVVTKAGHGEREMYVILEGVFEVIDGNDCRVALLTKGDPFGEVAFFRGSGRRSASVRAVEAGRVLVLRRRFLRELMNKNPDAAAKILYNLARVLADRLGSMVQERQLSQVAEEVDANASSSGIVERETG